MAITEKQNTNNEYIESDVGSNFKDHNEKDLGAKYIYPSSYYYEDSNYTYQMDGLGPVRCVKAHCYYLPYGGLTIRTYLDPWNETERCSDYITFDGDLSVHNLVPGRIVPGTKPMFKDNFFTASYTDVTSWNIPNFIEYKIEKNTASLDIYDRTYDETTGWGSWNPIKSFCASDFGDKAIPKRIIVEIQAAGGSGFWSSGSLYYGGGGGGAYLCLLVDLENISNKSIYITLGGAGKHNGDGQGNAKKSWIGLAQPNGSIIISNSYGYIINGGNGGVGSETSLEGIGGAGGIVEEPASGVDLGTYTQLLIKKDGANGGGTSAGSSSMFRIEANTHGIILGANSKTYYSKSGGTNTARWGGGGASATGAGTNGAQTFDISSVQASSGAGAGSAYIPPGTSISDNRGGGESWFKLWY